MKHIAPRDIGPSGLSDPYSIATSLIPRLFAKKLSVLLHCSRMVWLESFGSGLLLIIPHPGMSTTAISPAVVLTKRPTTLLNRRSYQWMPVTASAYPCLPTTYSCRR